MYSFQGALTERNKARKAKSAQQMIQNTDFYITKLTKQTLVDANKMIKALKIPQHRVK